MTEKNIPELTRRLNMPLPGQPAQSLMAPSFRPDFPDKITSAQAGVLVLLYPNPIELYIVLIKRSEYPGAHSGQISFPGGKSEPRDLNIIETALRETQEEIGVYATDIKVLGQLTPLYIPVSEFEVRPVVCFIPKKPEFRIDKNEVQYTIEASIGYLLQPFAKAIQPLFANDKFQGQVPYFDIEGNEVWGATAMILSEFLEIAKLIN